MCEESKLNEQICLIKEAMYAPVDDADPTKPVEGKLDGGGNRKLHCRYWRPVGKPRGLVMLIHGLAEHLQWYDELGRKFAKEGILAFGHDHIGHGLSDGERVHVDVVDEYVVDVFIHYDEMKMLYPDLPRFAVGHSMGGMILLTAALKNPREFKGIVLMGPLIHINPYLGHPICISIFKFASYYFPHFTVGKLDLTWITRDEVMRQKLLDDPLRWTGGVKIRWGIATHSALKYINENLQNMEVPFMIIHGELDKLCEVKGSEKLFEIAPVKDKEIKVVKGGHHHLYIEPPEVRNEAMSDTLTWIINRI
ncbi:monoglyceride lipase-like [Artemia franciscana]|uniref:Serine aminopeptidase S33 domain-containing protein n=1 Tax=Artemia franciscana TaxID=6661 RepID=A0AA88L7V7_ARTSF|nr:hypothetical protein QYM36_003822 [Artemia franciscana]